MNISQIVIHCFSNNPTGNIANENEIINLLKQDNSNC
ncbi:MAG: hypothetical protein CM15mP129_10360 [Chloroflexota bacterium]|nr:MAG: hypothetical protein CM15mP129_10360 [Chloroflexota bacterium]